LKIYTSRDPETSGLHGFFHGPYTDIMFARRITMYYIHAEDHAKLVEGQGGLFSLGYMLGYTWTIGRFMLEPLVGAGLAYADQQVLYPDVPGAIVPQQFGLNMSIAFSASHLQLHAGYVLTKKKIKAPPSVE
jgi:hypothetical protein